MSNKLLGSPSLSLSPQTTSSPASAPGNSEMGGGEGGGEVVAKVENIKKK